MVIQNLIERTADPSQTKPNRTAVIICTHTDDRWRLLEYAVRSAQRELPHEVVLVVDHNDDLLARAKSAFSHPEAGVPVVVVANLGPRGLSGARNQGMQATGADIVAFLDDDAEARPGWLVGLVDPFSDPDVISVGGRAEADCPDRFPSWWPHEFDWVVGCSWVGLPEVLSPIRNVIGCSMAFRREPVLEAGGFQTQLGRQGNNASGGEETELCIRLRRTLPSCEVLFEPRAVVLHHIDTSRLGLRYFTRRCFAEGRAKASIIRMEGTSVMGPESSFIGSVVRRAFLSGFRSLFRGDLPGVAQASAVIGGLGASACGFVWETMSRARR